MVLGLANARAAVNMHNCALSDTCGQAAMKLPRDERGIRNHYCAKLAPNGDIPVSVETLDNICAAISGPIRFIKVDTEGHELSVIRGGLQTLRRHRPILCIEISTDPDDIASDGATNLTIPVMCGGTENSLSASAAIFLSITSFCRTTIKSELRRDDGFRAAPHTFYRVLHREPADRRRLGCHLSSRASLAG
jgi:FkbM family methyltransferase